MLHLVAVAVPARLSADGFTSLWCIYAAAGGGAVALYVQVGRPAEPSMDGPARSDLAPDAA